MRQSLLRLAVLAGVLLVGSTVPRVAAAQAASQAAASAPNPFAGLALSEPQRVKLRALTIDMQNRRRAIIARQHNNAPMSAADGQELYRLAMAHNAALRAVLSAEQRSQFDDNVHRLEQEQQQRRDAAQKAKQARGRSATTPEAR